MGTYHRPNSPIATPVAQVHTHQRWSIGSEPDAVRTAATTKAIVQPMVITLVTCRSFASRGGAVSRGRPSRFDLACGSPITSSG
jgi:hypothetical protein